MTDLNDLFKQLAEEKAKDPKYQQQAKIRENVRADLNGLFSQLSSINKKVEEVQHPEVKAVVEEVVEAAVEQITEDVIVEVALPTPIGKVPEVAQIPDLDKYLKKKPELPKEDPLINQYKQVQDKLKFLEHWISKIQNTGPGSGEVNFRYLDDVARSTMNPENDNWVLEYDATTKKVQFTENIGPIRTLKFNTAGYQTPLVAGQLGWNYREDCLDIKQADDTTLQVGLEHYFQIHNGTGTQLGNGEVVMFAGVDEDDHMNPIVAVGRYNASASANPLYLVGVMTNDVPDGHDGRATVFGKVRNLNTTGASVGETWVRGELLWAHPTMPGKLTKVRPTAPSVATSVAAVLQVGTTDGVLLVRPTIWPRLYYGSWFSTENQTHALANTPYRITYNNEGATSGFTNVDGLITAQQAGLFTFQFTLQVTSTNSSAANYWIWYRKNGVDVPNSARKLSISSNSIVLAPSWNFPVSMQVGDTFELMWACDTGNKVSLSAQTATAFCPATPSAQLTVGQVNL